MSLRQREGFALAVLFAVNAMNFFDRQILGAVAEPVRLEFDLSDSAIGALGTAFILLYAAVGVPLGRLTDKGKRTRILAGGVFLWSLLTAASGAARNFAELFVARLGVGVGEATCAPACASLIGDLFPPARRARALAVFMMGLPIGIGMSYAVSGTVAQAWGWRSAFFLAFLPGLACALLSLYIPEPERGGAETHSVGARQRDGSPYLLVLSIPTLWWIIASGALHNFNMYALGTFLSPMLERYHHVNTAQAGFIAMATYGLAGVPGLWIGGQLADIAIRRAHSGRMLVGGVAILLSTPLLYLALARPAGDLAGFLVLMALGCGLMYIYYATVYATIQDVVEPSLRGTAMALYFFAMYVLGASLGPYLMGAASDHFALAAAAEAGISVPSAKDLEPVYRSLGLHRAMFLVPSLSAVLAAVLFAGAATVKRDMERLQSWMRGERTAEPRE